VLKRFRIVGPKGELLSHVYVISPADPPHRAGYMVLPSLERYESGSYLGDATDALIIEDLRKKMRIPDDMTYTIVEVPTEN